jgi:hypothetical protein
MLYGFSPGCGGDTANLTDPDTGSQQTAQPVDSRQHSQ